MVCLQVSFQQIFSVNKLCGLLIIFPYPAVSHVFQGPGSSGSRFFRVQVFQGPGPGSGSRIRVQSPSPGFRSSHFLPPFNYSKYVVKASCTDLYNNYRCNENERRIQGPAKHLRWSVLPKYLTPSSRYPFLQTLLFNSNIQIL